MAGLIDRVRDLDLTDYQRGVIDGMYRYAWMKDGVYYVGTTGTTLDAAIERVLAEEIEPAWTAYHEYRKRTDPPPYGQGLPE